MTFPLNIPDVYILQAELIPESLQVDSLSFLVRIVIPCVQRVARLF